VRRQTRSKSASRSASSSTTISPRIVIRSRFPLDGSTSDSPPSATRKIFFCSASHAMLAPFASSARTIFVSFVRSFVDQRFIPFSKRAR